MRLYILNTRRIILFLVYVVSFFCFASTSAFESIQKLTGSTLLAFIAVNLTVCAVLLVAFFSQANMTIMFSIASAVFCFPAVISLSRLNWLETVYNIKMKCSISGGLVALAVFFVVAGLYAAHYLSIHINQAKLLEDWGAAAADLDMVVRNQWEFLLYTFAFMALPAILIILVGFYVLRYEGIKLSPIMMVVCGVAIAVVGLWYYVRQNWD